MPDYQFSVLTSPYGEVTIQRPSDVSVQSDRYDGNPYENPELSDSDRSIYRIRVGGRNYRKGVDISIFISTPKNNLDVQSGNASIRFPKNRIPDNPVTHQISVIEKGYYRVHHIHYRSIFNEKTQKEDFISASFPFYIDGEMYEYSYSGYYKKIKSKVSCVGLQ